MDKSSPFQYKTKLEYTCESCNSNFKLVYFEEEVSGMSRFCPFCGEEVDEAAAYENSALKEQNERLYTDDDGALFENELMDDDY